MEDSGRDKLQGQNNTAEPSDAKADKAIDFDSASISEKQKEEHFTDIAGAEERARAEQMAKEAAKRAEAKVKAAAEKALKKEELTPNQKKAKRKKNIIALIIGTVLIVIAAFLGYLAYRKINPTPDRAREESYEIYEQAKEIMGNGNSKARSESKAFIEEKIEASKGTRKFYLLLMYAEYLNYYHYDYKEAVKALDEAESLIKNEEMEQEYLQRGCQIISMHNYDMYIERCADKLKFDDEENEQEVLE